jgi:hypothetical protein
MPDRWVNPHGWGPPPPGSGPPSQGLSPPQPSSRRPSPRRPSPSDPWWRRWYVLLAALVLLGVVALAALVVLAVALGDGNDASNTASRSTAPPATRSSLPTVATTSPTTSTAPPTTIPTVKVPNLVGMNLARAKAILADRGLRGTIGYRSTARYAAGTVISQSRRAGARVGPDSRITVVVAKAPPPPPTTAPPPPPTSAPRNCDPSYPDVCLDPNAEDYDCAGGSGNGPLYVEGPISVRPPDPFGLDADGDGVGCERD